MKTGGMHYQGEKYWSIHLHRTEGADALVFIQQFACQPIWLGQSERVRDCHLTRGACQQPPGAARLSCGLMDVNGTEK